MVTPKQFHDLIPKKPDELNPRNGSRVHTNLKLMFEVYESMSLYSIMRRH